MRALTRIFARPRLLIGVTAAVLLACVWVGWAIRTANLHGGNAALGVLVAWPAMLAALALVASPFIGAWLLIRQRTGEDAEASADTAGAGETDGAPAAPAFIAGPPVNNPAPEPEAPSPSPEGR